MQFLTDDKEKNIKKIRRHRERTRFSQTPKNAQKGYSKTYAAHRIKQQNIRAPPFLSQLRKKCINSLSLLQFEAIKLEAAKALPSKLLRNRKA